METFGVPLLIDQDLGVAQRPYCESWANSREAARGAAPQLLITFLLLAAPALCQTADLLLYDPSVRPVTFAASEIQRVYATHGRSLQERGLDSLDVTAPMRIVIAAGPEQSSRVSSALSVTALERQGVQSYSIRRKDDTIAVLGEDAAGAMYGGLDVAEALRLGTLDQLRDSDHTPHVEKRGIKFNIPLDSRTPTYSDNSDAAQYNIPVMWEFDFWRDFIDDMARHRYNALTLWSLNPFPSMVKVPEFPDIALDDVKRTTIPMDDTFSHSGHDMMRPDMWDNLETVKHLTIDQKIHFWRDVMQYALDRGVNVWIFTWNIFTHGENGKYGITSAQDNETTIKYYRASVREMVLTYPLLAGIGITSGERMQRRDDEYGKEKWLWRTYGEGIRDAKKLQPNRDFQLIHRFHQTAMTEILDAWQDFPNTFHLSFKYALAHMHSVPDPPFILPVLPHLSPKTRTWLTVRNDDIYSFRWGDPDFARAFVKHMPGKDKVVGFYMGPDGYTWGREHLSNDPLHPRQTVIAKQWYSFMLWGRLSYDPDLPDELFQRTIAQRFPEVPAGRLFRAWAQASRIFPRLTSFFWDDFDFQWFPEACLSHPRYNGFYTIKHMMTTETMPGSGIYDILEWRTRKAAGQSMDKETPLKIADDLEQYAKTTLELVEDLKPLQGNNRELRLTLGDLVAFAHLGYYYAEKIRGTAGIALFDKTSDSALQASAVRHLRRALDHWKFYARAYTNQYEQPRLYNRVGLVDIPALATKVEQDILMAQTWTPGTVPDDAPKRHSRARPFRE